jgi:multidrug efflux pump
MALAVSVGFVVDDAIVMIETAIRYLDRGASPLRYTLKGAKQIVFTVVSISVSLIAAFIPLLFMGGIVGRLFREFSVTLAFAIAISTVVSLSVTPMICAYFVRRPPSRDATWLDRRVEGLLSRVDQFLRPHTVFRTRAPSAHAHRLPGNDRAHHWALYQGAQRLFPAG